ncbi:hypothetical protein SteCoe_23993 [Stentor coeruleus]|uniref:Uncharacterized protein n=1 Tax=Stentor coeruleus TaxID=5963 RepID=A0A1R2BJ26_9CILI|nr:hypothetical protein SteCoe_23993 [Stentor coeruleus]
MKQEESKLNNSFNDTQIWKCSSENILSLSPLAHKRSISTSSENLGISVITNEKSMSPSRTSPKNLSKLCSFLIPYSSHSRSPPELAKLCSFLIPYSSHSRSPPELDSPVKEKRNMSVIGRLNEEILILSTQLKQANEIIAFLSIRSNEFQDLNEKYKQNQIESDKNQAEMHKKLIVLEEKLRQILIEKDTEIKNIKDFHIKEIQSIEIDKEKLIQDIIHENKKKLVLVENHFIEIIMNLNHKYIEEVEYLNKKYRKKMHNLVYSDKLGQIGIGEKESYEGSTIYSLNMDSIKKNDASFSSLHYKKPMVKRSQEIDVELDMSLRQIFNQVNLSLDSDKFKENRSEYEHQLRASIHSIFDLCSKKATESKDLFCKWDETPKSKDLFLEFSLEKLSKRTILNYFHLLTGSFFNTLSHLLSKLQKKSFFLSWKIQKSIKTPLVFPYSSAFSINQTINKKIFSIFWNTWSALKTYNKKSIIQNKKLMKATIEKWGKLEFSMHDSVIEAFYHWRSIKAYDKINKLKEFKRFFIECS